MRLEITPQTVETFETVQSIVVSISAAGFIALCTLPFVLGGRWIAVLIGG